MSWLTEWYMESTDKISRLHVCRWLPDDKNVKAVLQLSHGIMEHIGRFDTFARFIANNGFAVVGNSILGHGKSASDEPDIGFIAEKDGWNLAVRDMRLLWENTSSQYPGQPYFLLGHSMSSFLARTFLIRYQSILTGCILSGTGQQASALLNAGLIAAGTERLLFGPRHKSAHLNHLCFGVYNRRIPCCRTPSDWLTRDHGVVERYMADAVCGFVPSVGLFADMLGGLKYVGRKKNIAKMRKDLPVLLISGAEDPVGDYGIGVKKVYKLFRDAGMSDVTLKLYEGARHEVLNETNKEDVWQDVLGWMKDRIER
ncbi:MAG: alpha/beta hydrolase [Clostridiales bacterium]|nr:alpha/beta hydrolase [Clostridiales bacterium]